MSVPAHDAHSGFRWVALAEPLDADPPADNRRQHVRVRQDDVSWLNNARLKYGPPVQVLNISVGGVQIGTKEALRPGATIVIEFARADGPLVVPVRVLRCQEPKHKFDWYRSGCQFKRPLDLPELIDLQRHQRATTHILMDAAR